LILFKEDAVNAAYTQLPSISKENKNEPTAKESECRKGQGVRGAGQIKGIKQIGLKSEGDSFHNKIKAG